MKLTLCAALLAATALSACAGGYGHRGYEYQGRHWDRREKVCDVKPNGKRVCTWRYS